MSENRRSNASIFGWILMGVWFFGSLGGIFYSFRFLVSAIFCVIAAACAWPRENKTNVGWEALKKIKNWENNGGPRPQEEVFMTAAQWYMYNIDTVRREDLDGSKGAAIPSGVKPYIKSEKELKRQKGVIF